MGDAAVLATLLVLVAAVLHAVALGARMLREPFGVRRIAAALLVVIGLFLLHVVA